MREDARDAFISDVVPSFDELPMGARLGTASLRRQAQALALRPDLQIEMLRGNVDTRLRRLADGEFDAVVTMGCGDNCPWVPARVREDWALPDPKHMDDEGYRAVRDEIGRRVQALLASL